MLATCVIATTRGWARCISSSRPRAPPTCPGFDRQGPEAGALPWNADEFARRAKATRRELRNLLMSGDFIAGIGNAYADEILWQAKLHPKRRVASLDDGEMDRLYGALRETLARAVEIVENELPPELGTKIRTHMKIRGKVGDPCARCGTKIVRTRHGLDEMFVCPEMPAAAERDSCASSPPRRSRSDACWVWRSIARPIHSAV